MNCFQDPKSLFYYNQGKCEAFVTNDFLLYCIFFFDDGFVLGLVL